MITCLYNSDYGLSEKCGEHGEGGDGELVLSAEQTGDFARSFTYGVGKLLLRESLFLHQEVKTVGDLK